MNDPDRQIWAQMLAYLRRHWPTLCRQWFDDLEPLMVDSGALHLRAQSPLHRDYLQRQTAHAFNEAAQSVTGRLLSVRFLGPDDPSPIRQAGRAASMLEVKSPQTPPTVTQYAPPAGLQTGTKQPAGTSSSESGPGPSSNGAPRPPRAGLGSPNISEPVRSLIVESPRSGNRWDEALVVNPDCNFESFVVGMSNRMSHAAAVAVASAPGRAFNPLFIHGGVGLGKTHLLQAICIQIKQANPAAVICYLSCEAFVTRFIEALRTNEMADFRNRFRDMDCLIIDDIHFLKKADHSQEEFFHTFNTLYQAGKQIVLSSDAPPQEIPELEERLVSRFAWGLVTQIEPPDFETRAAILRSKARLRGIELPDEVSAFIAGRITANIRELEGAIGKLQIHAAVDGRAIDMELAMQAIGDITSRDPHEPTIQTIIDAVTDFYRVRLIDLQSERRHRSVAQPRQVCMALIRMLTKHSLEEIGGYFGNRDHTTVLHAIRTVDERRAAEPDFDVIVRTLESKIRGMAEP